MTHSDIDDSSKRAKVVILASYAQSLINFRYHLLKGISRRGHEVIAIAPQADESVITKLNSIGVQYSSISLNRTGNNPIEDLKTICSLILLLRRHQPDVLLSYTIKPVIYGSLAAKILGVPSINSMITGLGSLFNNPDKRNLIFNILRALYRYALNVNKVVFFQNQDDFESLVHENILLYPGKAAFINGSGVDLTHFSPTPSIENPVSFLLIARLIKDKGIIEYIEAAKLIKAKYPKVVFRLVGPFDTNPTALSKQQVQEWQDTGIIEYLGQQNDVRESIAQTSIYVLPSYREGTPRSVLEAMAMGKPIITTNTAGCKDTVIEGENGFLVDVKNVTSLAVAMGKFIEHPEMITTMGQKSRKLAEEKYDVHNVNHIILKALEL